MKCPICIICGGLHRDILTENDRFLRQVTIGVTCLFEYLAEL